MALRARRVVSCIVVFVLVVVVGVAALAFFAIRRPFPQVDGEIRVQGIRAPVDILRDKYGVPHIYASTTEDLFFAQGFVHAQDRFWQMDFWRHVGSGRVAELFGKSALKTDQFLRTLGWARIVRKELEGLDDESRKLLVSYAAGVNAYISGRGLSELSLEHALLGLQRRGYKPEPWEPLHSMTWAKAMAWDLSENMRNEITRARLLKTLTAAQIDELYPPYPQDRPTITDTPAPAIGHAPVSPINLADEAAEKVRAHSAASDLWAVGLPQPERSLTLSRKRERETVVATAFSLLPRAGEGPGMRALQARPGCIASASEDGMDERGPCRALPPQSIQDALASADQNVSGALELLGPKDAGIGSNNWALSGRLTATGKPILANDPHLGVQIPSIWYQVDLHCEPRGPNCPYEVAGFSFPSAPGVIIGHNDKIAWAMTNVGADVMDLYVEKINPENPLQYEVNGNWENVETISETIQVAGGDPVDLKVRVTRHGPIISDNYSELRDFEKGWGGVLPPKAAVALRWTALEPSGTFDAIWKLNRAENWDDFRAAAREFDVPSQNMVYADVDGHIGYQTPGKIPVRSEGEGLLPVPGWTDQYEWKGFIPFEELPTAFDPESGYIASANNAVVPADFPHLLTRDWDYGYRAQRIVEMIEGRKGPLSVEDVAQMQGDAKNLHAPAVVAVLKSVQIPESAAKARQLLDLWDFQNDKDSAGAAIFEVFWARLMEDAFADELPTDLRAGGGSRWMTMVGRMLAVPDSPWWDNKKTPTTEQRDAILTQAFTEAVAELEKRLGPDPESWRWGSLHTVTFRNASFGQSGIEPIELLFNRGPFATSGGTATVNATSWRTTDGYHVVAVPSMRTVMDVSNWDNSRAILTTGQSGHPFHPHYFDMTSAWVDIRTNPMIWSRERVEAESEGRLKLVPNAGR